MQIRFYNNLNTFLKIFYFNQSNIVYLNSYKRPNIINILIIKKENINANLFIIIIKGKGKITTISTSKIKKTMPIKKNFKENGTRESEKGSNPHSKGEFFSLAFFPWKAKEKNKVINKIITILIVVYK